MGGQFPLKKNRAATVRESFPRIKQMNNPTPVKPETQPIDEAHKLISILHAHDVLSLIFRPEECKRLIVKLGLTIPIGKDKCMLCGNDGKGCIYLFACNPESPRDKGHMDITGYRFDVEQYKSHPVKGLPDAWTAFRYCSMALAHVEGLDATKSCFQTSRPLQN
jgi:hypothetical protein